MLAPNVKTVALILVMIVPFVCAYVDKAGKLILLRNQINLSDHFQNIFGTKVKGDMSWRVLGFAKFITWAGLFKAGEI